MLRDQITVWKIGKISINHFEVNPIPSTIRQNADFFVETNFIPIFGFDRSIMMYTTFVVAR